MLQKTASDGVIQIRLRLVHEGVTLIGYVAKINLQTSTLQTSIATFSRQSGCIYGRQISLVLGGCSAVAMLTRVLGTTALSSLVDQAVFGSQPVPRNYAAVESTKHCRVGLIKPLKRECLRPYHCSTSADS